MGGNQLEIIRCKGLEELSIIGAERLVALANKALLFNGRFTLSLAGGSTPRSLYRLLSSGKYRNKIPWHKVHLFWGDERCVAPDHPDSNYWMVKEELLSAIDIPSENVHRIKGELGEAAAPEYENTLKDSFGMDVNPFPSFDLILLGMGDDGHTASLFPGTPAVSDDKRWVREVFVERLGSTRVSITPPVINSAADIMLLVSGEGKAPALKEVIEGDFDPCRYPAQILRMAGGSVTWLVDEAAAGLLTEGLNITETPYA